MTNGEIYRKTFKFSIMKVIFGFVGVILLVGIPVAAILIAGAVSEGAQVIAGIVGVIVGIIACVLIGRFTSYVYKAGQIAMVAQAVDTGTLPQDAYAAGKQAVKERFGTVAAYFALMALIKGISSAITNGVNKIASAVGGSNNTAAETIGGIVSTCISLVLEYVNYCSLGWVFIHRDDNAFKSTCDGAVIYFQNWKALLANAGKIIGITAVSLVIIGGVFALVFYNVFAGFPHVASAMAQIDEILELDAGTCYLGLIVICALAIWWPIHSALIEPVILISVMRRYVDAGKANPPKIDIYGKLAGMSKHFRKSMEKAEREGGLPQGTTAQVQGQI